MQVVHTHTCNQNTQTHKKKTLKKWNKQVTHSLEEIVKVHSYTNKFYNEYKQGFQHYTMEHVEMTDESVKDLHFTNQIGNETRNELQNSNPNSKESLTPTVSGFIKTRQHKMMKDLE